jgi:hypothetical protein
VLKPFREETQASPVPEYDLDEVGSGAAPEYKQVAGERILPQQALHQHGEAIDALAHIDVAQGQVHFHAGRKQGHDTAPSTVAAAQDGAAMSVI